MGRWYGTRDLGIDGKNNLFSHIGNRISTLRKTKKMTQQKLAEKAQIHFTNLSKAEKKGQVSADLVLSCAWALGVSIYDLLDIKEPITGTDKLVTELIELIDKIPAHLRNSYIKKYIEDASLTLKSLNIKP